MMGGDQSCFSFRLGVALALNAIPVTFSQQSGEQRPRPRVLLLAWNKVVYGNLCSTCHGTMRFFALVVPRKRATRPSDCVKRKQNCYPRWSV
jgi:hypothetical protein